MQKARRRYSAFKPEVILSLALGMFLAGCATPSGTTDSTPSDWKKPSSPEDREVTLISDKDNTRFRLQRAEGAEMLDLGSGRFVKARLPRQGGYVLFAKAPGYKEKSSAIQETVDPVRFVFLEEERVLTIRCDLADDTEYRIRRTGQARWQFLGSGKLVEYWVPREGQFEIEARPKGYAAQILPVIDRTGELVFNNFIVPREVTLTSTEDYTRFLTRDVREGSDAWEYAGVGKVVKIQVPADETFEVAAQPLHHVEKHRLVTKSDVKVDFIFTDADKKGATEERPVSRGESIVPRPLKKVAGLASTELSKLSEGESWVAVLVGISDYSGSGGAARDLLTPSSDVTALARLLTENYGFRSVTTLLDGKATLEGVRQELFKLHLSCRPNDNVLIYYAGHGTLEPNGAGTWILADGGKMPNAEAKDFLQRFPARRALLVCDSCFSGAFLQRDIRVHYLPEPAVSHPIDPVPTWVPGNVAASREVLSSGNLTPVPDAGSGYCQNHSPFSCCLLTALQDGIQPGAVVGVTDLHTHICEELEKSGVTEGQMPQRGAIDGDHGGEYFFVRFK